MQSSEEPLVAQLRMMQLVVAYPHVATGGAVALVAVAV